MSGSPSNECPGGAIAKMRRRRTACRVPPSQRRGSAALLLGVGADLVDLLLARQDVRAVHPRHVLKALERILWIAVGEADVVGERPLTVEVTHRDVAQQCLVPGAAQGIAELHAVGR